MLNMRFIRISVSTHECLNALLYERLSQAGRTANSSTRIDVVITFAVCLLLVLVSVLFFLSLPSPHSQCWPIVRVSAVRILTLVEFFDSFV